MTCMAGSSYDTILDSPWRSLVSMSNQCHLVFCIFSHTAYNYVALSLPVNTTLLLCPRTLYTKCLGLLAASTVITTLLLCPCTLYTKCLGLLAASTVNTTLLLCPRTLYTKCLGLLAASTVNKNVFYLISQGTFWYFYFL